MTVNAVSTAPAGTRAGKSGSDATGRWRTCPACGLERRLAAGSVVMCDHRRWDPSRREMIPCEGAGRHPAPDGSAA